MLNFALALVVPSAALEALLLLSGNNYTLFCLMRDHGVFVMLLLYAVSLYVFCIRKPLLKDRKEYLISTELGHCGELLEFDKSKFPNAKRMPWDYLLCLWAGVRTYQTDTSELFTTYRGKFSVPYKQIAAGVLCIFVLLCPISLPYQLNTINAKRGQTLYDEGKSKTPEVYPVLKEYNGVFSIAKLADNLFQKDTTDTADTANPETPEQTDTSTDTSADKKTGFFQKITSFFKGKSSDKTADAQYLLPSDSRELTEDDVAGLSHEDIQLRINEMYARHGFVFSEGSANAEYFSQQDWYSPDASLSQEDVYAQFSDLEKQNLIFLSNHRN